MSAFLEEVPLRLRGLVGDLTSPQGGRGGWRLLLEDDLRLRGMHRRLRVGLLADSFLDLADCAALLFVWRLPNSIYMQPAEVLVCSLLDFDVLSEHHRVISRTTLPTSLSRLSECTV